MRTTFHIVLIIVGLMALFFDPAVWACDGTDRYDVTVFPEVNQPGLKQDAIVYHFNGDRVTSTWGRRMTYPNKSRTVLSAELEGTFINGKLACVQTAEMKIYLPQGMEHPGVPDGLQQIHKLVSTIAGTLNSKGKIVGTVKTETRQILSRLPDTSQQGAPYVWTNLPVDPATAMESIPLFFDLPVTHWYASAHIIACGEENNRVRRTLERIDDHWNAATMTINRTKYKLAQSQLETLQADILDLKKEIDKGDLDCSIVFTGLPTDPVMIRLIRLRFMWAKWKESYLVVNEALGEVQKQLYETKRVLSINVFKSVLKNYINWSNSIPTDVTAGLSQYSFTTGLSDFPRSGLGMVAEAEKDAGILGNQFKTKRVLEKLEPFYDKKRDYVIKQAKRTTNLIRKMDPKALEAMDHSLQHFFTGLGWAAWQENNVRKKALKLLTDKTGNRE